MSLFALNYEYQRSIDRLWEDFSVVSQAKPEPVPEQVEYRRHQSVFDLDNRRKALVQKKNQKTITPPFEDSSELMQLDAKAWGRFLDSKLKQ